MYIHKFIYITHTSLHRSVRSSSESTTRSRHWPRLYCLLLSLCCCCCSAGRLVVGSANELVAGQVSRQSAKHSNKQPVRRFDSSRNINKHLCVYVFAYGYVCVCIVIARNVHNLSVVGLYLLTGVYEIAMAIWLLTDNIHTSTTKCGCV